MASHTMRLRERARHTDLGSDNPPTISNNAGSVVASVGKKATRRPPVRKGSLQNLTKCAIEIQLEVFGNLHPQDLYNLSRTCKAFRAFFLHQSNERLWKASLEQTTDLPQRPPFLSIPAFVHFLYSGPYCQNCACANVHEVFWPWGRRYCKKCVYDLSYELDDAHKKLNEVHGWLSEISTKLRTVTVTCPKDKEKCNRQFKQDVEEWINQWRELPQPVTRGAWKECRRKHFLDTEDRHKRLLNCKAWFDRRARAREAALEEARKTRFEVITSRLKQSGWSAEIEFLGNHGLENLKKFPTVWQSSQLTERGWTKVFEKLAAFLNETRQRRLNVEHAVVLRERFSMLDKAVLAHYVQEPRTPIMDIRPYFIDFAFMKECRALIDAPASEPVTANDFTKIIPALGAEWEANRRRVLTAVLLQHLGQVPDGVDPLKLAMGFFLCPNRCSLYPKYFPDVLNHTCTPTNLWAGILEDQRGDDLYATTAIAYKRGRIPISFDIRSAKPEASPFVNLDPGSLSDPERTPRVKKIMQDIITALGLDPATATVEDLENCDVRLRCVQCEKNLACPHVHGWESAVNHALEYTSERASRFSLAHAIWERVPAHEIPRVKKIEQKQKSQNGPRCIPSHMEPEPIWSCSLCKEWNGGDVVPHLRRRHQVEYTNKCITDGTIYLNHGLTNTPVVEGVQVPKLAPDAALRALQD